MKDDLIEQTDIRMREYITAQIGEARRVMAAMLMDDSLLAQVERAALACVSSIKNGGKVLLAGNGGGQP